MHKGQKSHRHSGWLLLVVDCFQDIFFYIHKKANQYAKTIAISKTCFNDSLRNILRGFFTTFVHWSHLWNTNPLGHKLQWRVWSVESHVISFCVNKCCQLSKLYLFFYQTAVLCFRVSVMCNEMLDFREWFGCGPCPEAKHHLTSSCSVGMFTTHEILANGRTGSFVRYWSHFSRKVIHYIKSL